MSKKQNEKAIRLLTLGNSMVGKSSIILRYIENKFYDSYISTIGVDFFKKMVNIQKKEYQLHIFDSAGQEKYKSISKQYYHRSEGIMLVFDLTSKSSFDSILNWIEDIENGAEKGIPIVLVGNKSDLVDREVSKEEAEELASKKGMEYFETSALDGSGIDNAFLKLAELVIKNEEQKKEAAKGKALTLASETKEKKCC
jgi:small GTP-binding protein